VELSSDALRLSMTEPNFLDASAIRQAFRAVLERAGILGGGRVALVLPDPVARLALVPNADIQARRRAEGEEMLRFRLKKSVPFDIREARVATLAAGSSAGTPQTLVGAILNTVLGEYEATCRNAGLEPGLVLLSGVALLWAVEASRPPGDRVVVNWDRGYVSILLTRHGEPVLIRTLTGEGSSEPGQVIREAAQTAVYYRERLQGQGFQAAFVRSGFLPPEEACRLLEDALGLRPMPLDPWGSLSPTCDEASTQALAGAAAALSQRAA
jgi:hypothetical protein